MFFIRADKTSSLGGDLAVEMPYPARLWLGGISLLVINIILLSLKVVGRWCHWSFFGVFFTWETSRSLGSLGGLVVLHVPVKTLLNLPRILFACCILFNIIFRKTRRI